MNPNRPYDPHYAVFYSLALIVGFGLFRALALWIHPIHDLDDWVWVDTAKNIPRLLGFLIALWLGLRYWSKNHCGFHWRGRGWGMLVLLAATIFSALFHILWIVEPVYLGADLFALLALNSVLVALFEETIFRVLLFNGLADRWGRLAALWGSSLAFMIFHLQAQELILFPVLFAWGFLFGILRFRGVGVYWILLIHFFYDTLVLVADGKKVFSVTTATLAEFVMVAVLIAIISRAKRDPFALED